MEGYYGFLGVQNGFSNRGDFHDCAIILHSLLRILFEGISCIFGQVVAEMAAIGFGLPKDAFTSLMKQVRNSSLHRSFLLCIL